MDNFVETSTTPLALLTFLPAPLSMPAYTFNLYNSVILGIKSALEYLQVSVTTLVFLLLLFSKCKITNFS